MSAGHGAQSDVLVPLDGPLERLASQCKIMALVGFVIAVVLTPAGHWPAFAIDAAAALGLAVVALVPPSTIAKRLMFELPFVALAASMAIVGDSTTAATLLVRVTIALVAVSVLIATTTPGQIITGFERLHVPAALTAVAAAAVRQLEVLRDDVARLRVARIARGGSGRRQFAGTGATLFVRSIERAERVSAAMVARGHPGVVTPSGRPAAPNEWALAALPTVVAALAGVLA